MIIENSIMIDAFSRHFNTRLTTSDFTDNADQLLSILNKKDKLLTSAIILPCEEELLYQQLTKFRYHELLNLIAQRITIATDLLDVYISEIDPNLLFVFLEFLEYSKKQLNVVLKPESNQFLIIAPELFVDITIGAFSQLHTEVTSQLSYFNKLIAIRAETSDNPTENLFINSKLPTAYSSFIITYIAENLDIKLQL